jgi:hypothetical protein
MHSPGGQKPAAKRCESEVHDINLARYRRVQPPSLKDGPRHTGSRLSEALSRQASHSEKLESLFWRARFYAGAGKGAQDAVNEAARAVDHGRGSVSSHEMCCEDSFLTRLEFADSGSE